MDLDLGQVVLTTNDADGIPHVGIDVPGGQEAGATPFEAHYPFGVDGRPRDPTPGPDGQTILGCSTLYGYLGNDQHAWPLGDPRALVKLPVLEKGSWRAYCDTGRPTLPTMVLDGSSGSWTVTVPHLQGATSSSIRIDVATPGEEQVYIDTETRVGDPATAQNVALYPPLQPFLQETLDLLSLIVVGDPAAIPPVPGLAPILAPFPGGAALASAMTTQLGLLKAAALTALSASTASSAVLKASTE